MNLKLLREHLHQSAAEEATRARDAEHAHQALMHRTREALLREILALIGACEGAERSAADIGQAGGVARAKRLAPSRRSAIAREAANKRWGNPPK